MVALMEHTNGPELKADKDPGHGNGANKRAYPFTGRGSTSSTQTGCLHLGALKLCCSNSGIPFTERRERSFISNCTKSINLATTWLDGHTTINMDVNLSS